jgi:hypothetical protein
MVTRDLTIGYDDLAARIAPDDDRLINDPSPSIEGSRLTN